MFLGTWFTCDNCSTSRIPSCLGLGVPRERYPVSHRLPDAVNDFLPCTSVFALVYHVLQCCLSNAALSITTFHKSRASNPSIRSPASKEVTSDSVELWDTDVCFLHIQTNVRLPNIHKIRPEADFESPTSPAKSESWSELNRQC